MKPIPTGRVGILLTATVAVLACGAPPPTPARSPSSLAIVLAEHTGGAPIDAEIRGLQARLSDGAPSALVLERLGWVFVTKARRSHDPGYYRLAEHCALALGRLEVESAAALLLRGHALHGLHRFAEAGAVAQRLVRRRGLAADHGLLGDTLMERGRLRAAVAAYQRMVDLRPDAHSYSRVAHVRYLTGDLAGAIDAMALAAAASSPRGAETFAWMWARLALYQLHAGAFDAAAKSVARALDVDPGSATALLVRGQILLAQDRARDAVAPLGAAAERNPLPDVLWTLAEALRAGGQSAEAERVATQLGRTGEGSDPRGYALYLATLGADVAKATVLARRELRARRDVHTFDALAWAEAASGNVRRARRLMRRALAAGTQEARLFYHAGVIAAAAGADAEAAAWFRKAGPIAHMLLPSERTALARHRAPA